MERDDIESKITNIVPKYDYKNVAGGYFEIHFDFDESDPFKLSFVPFLDYRIRNDNNLFEYLKKTAGDGTCSHAIFDLYDMGFPVDQWVEDYVEMAKDNISADLFNALMQFYVHLKKFGNNPTGSLE